MYRATQPGYIMTSTDYGNTWAFLLSQPNTAITNQCQSGTNCFPTGLGLWCAVACNPSSGQYVAAYYFDPYESRSNFKNPRMYISSDYGSTWTIARNPALQDMNVRIAFDSTGQYVAATFGTLMKVYTSTNFGATWNQKTSAPSVPYSMIVSSSDGMKLAAVDSRSRWAGGYTTSGLWTSNDRGNTWAEI